jgi:spore germination cell wall hydrolase CwlJ-like protein
MLATRSRSFFVAGLMMMAAVTTLPASVGMAADVPAAEIAAAADSELADLQAQPDPAAVECMAKVVMHEAGNQPHDGKVAVAETLVNRLAAGRFGGSICAVANQPGQFFNTAAYNPDRDADSWTSAVEVARAVLSGQADPVAPGAMFFRASTHAASTFFRSRQRVASVGAHIFYR